MSHYNLLMIILMFLNTDIRSELRHYNNYFFLDTYTDRNMN